MMQSCCNHLLFYLQYTPTAKRLLGWIVTRVPKWRWACCSHCQENTATHCQLPHGHGYSAFCCASPSECLNVFMSCFVWIFNVGSVRWFVKYVETLNTFLTIIITYLRIYSLAIFPCILRLGLSRTPVFESSPTVADVSSFNAAARQAWDATQASIAAALAAAEEASKGAEGEEKGSRRSSLFGWLLGSDKAPDSPPAKTADPPPAPLQVCYGAKLLSGFLC